MFLYYFCDFHKQDPKLKWHKSDKNERCLSVSYLEILPIVFRSLYSTPLMFFKKKLFNRKRAFKKALYFKSIFDKKNTYYG